MSENSGASEPYLLKLPIEILESIFVFLAVPSRPIVDPDSASPSPPSTHAALRLTSKSLTAVATNFVFGTLIFTLTPRSVQNLEAISQSPMLSESTRCIEYCMDRLPVCSSKEAFKRAILHLPYESKGPRDVNSETWLMKAWEDYCAIRDYQESFYSDSQPFRAFSKIFAAFPSLRLFRVTGAWSGDCSLHMGASSDHHYRNSGLLPIPLGYNTGTRLLADLFRALSQNNRGLNGIETYYIPYVMFAGALNGRRLGDDWTKIFQNLTHLRMTVYPSRAIRGIGSIREGLLAVLIRLAPKLRTLELRLNYHFKDASFDIRSETRRGMTLRNSLALKSWPNLCSLSLGPLQMTSDDFLRLLKRHTPALRRLKLCEMYLSDGHWADIFDFIYNMRLERVHLSGWFTDLYQERCLDLPIVFEADGSIEIKFDGQSFDRVRLWPGNWLGRLLTGQISEDSDNELARCVDWWLRQPSDSRAMASTLPSVPGKLMGGFFQIPR